MQHVTAWYRSVWCSRLYKISKFNYYEISISTCRSSREWYSSDWCYSHFPISKLQFFGNSLFGLAEIRTSALRHISPECWPLEHGWHKRRWGNMVTWASIVWPRPPRYTPLHWPLSHGYRPPPSPARPPFWPAWVARQPRKTRNFERVLRALPFICTP
jgi:hypothetical protein